jgi:hypothetical protein
VINDARFYVDSIKNVGVHIYRGASCMFGAAPFGRQGYTLIRCFVGKAGKGDIGMKVMKRRKK